MTKQLLAVILIFFLIILIVYKLNLERKILEKTQSKNQIYALGDSLTLGTGSGEFNYTDKLFELLNQKIINKGVSRNTTEMMLNRLDFLEDAKYVIVWGGINDIYQNIPIDNTEYNLQMIYNKIHNSGGKVITINITPSMENKSWTLDRQNKTERLNNWIANSNADYKVDAYKIVEGRSGTILKLYDSGDHLHLQQDGYYAVANKVYEIISR